MHGLPPPLAARAQVKTQNSTAGEFMKSPMGFGVGAALFAAAGAGLTYGLGHVLAARHSEDRAKRPPVSTKSVDDHDADD